MGKPIGATPKYLVLCTEIISKCLEHNAGIIVKPAGYAWVQCIPDLHFVKQAKSLFNSCIFRDFSGNFCHFVK